MAQVRPLSQLREQADQLIRLFCNQHDVAPFELLRPQRGPAWIVELRDELALQLYEHFGGRLSKSNIGWLLGRDHSSIVSAMQRAQQRREQEDAA